VIRIDGASYLNGYRSLMFFMHRFNVIFINVKNKTCFNVFFLFASQFLTSMV